jgi:hypothetical protein
MTDAQVRWGLAGGVISLVALVWPADPHRLLWLGGGMAAAMWLSALYILRKAPQIAASAAQEQWAS